MGVEMSVDAKEIEQSAFVSDDDLYGKRTKAVPTPERKKDIDTDSTFYQNIIDASVNSKLDITSFSSLQNTAQNRNDIYNIYDSMCQDTTLSAVVETYAEDATERNDNGKIVWVESENSDVASLVDYYIDTLNVDKNIYKWVHSLCKYGDLYLRLYRESDFSDELFDGAGKNTDEQEVTDRTLNEDVKVVAYKKDDNYVHYMEMVQNPAEMFEVTKFGKTIGYVHSPVNATLSKNETTNLLQYLYSVQRKDIFIYPATEFVHASLENNEDRSEEILSIFTEDANNTDETNTHKYKVRRGQSLLASVFSTWRELKLLENSVLMYRLTKSPRIRMVNVEVGDMPKENVRKTLLGIKSMIEQKTAMDAGNSMSEYTNPGPIENTIYVPTHGGVGNVATSEIGGDVDVKSLADLDYYTDKLFGGLRVPKQYFGRTDDSAGFNGGSSLSIISSRYAKMIKRIQNTILQALTDAINLMLLDKGLESYVNDFTLHMLPPTTQEEIDRREALSGEVALTGDIMNMLADIEDTTVRITILKSLLSHIITNTDVINEIQAYIDKMKAQENEEVPTDDITSEEDVSDFGGSDFGGGPSMGGEDMGLNDMSLGGEDSEEAPAEDDGEEVILPSGDDLGIDLSADDEEE